MAGSVDIKIAAHGISTVNRRLKSVGAAFGAMKTKIIATAGPLGIALGAGGVVAALVKSVSESVKFEDALLDLQKVMDSTDGSAKQFTGVVDKLAERYGVASSSVLQGVANFKQAGFTIKESFNLQRAALDLVIAGDLEATEASELLVSALKGFKAPASEATRLIDIMNEVSNQYATDLKELGIGMSSIAPIANLMGFSFEETAGVLTPVIEVFRSGKEAAVALKTGLLNLVSDQKPVQDALASLGISQKDVNGELRSGKDILNDVASAFTGLNKEQKIYIASQLAGKEQAGRMVEVFNGLAKTAEITKAALNSNGSAIKEVDLRLESTGKNIDRFKVAFNNLARDIGDAFSPALLAVLGDFRQVFEDIKKSGAIGSMTQKVKILAPLVRGVVEVFKVLIKDVSAVVKFIAKLPVEFNATVAAALLLLSPIGQILLAVGMIEAAIKSLPLAWNLVKEANARVVLLMLQGVNKIIDAINKIPGVKLGKVDTSGQEALVETLKNITIESEHALNANNTLFQTLVDNAAKIKKSLGTTKGTTDGSLPEDGISEVASPEPWKKQNQPFVDSPLLPIKQGKKTIEEWRKAMDEFEVITDDQMKKAALSSLQNFKKIEESGQLTGVRLAAVWSDQVGPELSEVFDTLDSETQQMVIANNKRFEDIANKGISEMNRLGANTSDVVNRLKGPFTDFFMNMNQGWSNTQNLVVGVVGVIKRKLAELAADKAIGLLTNVLTGGSSGLISGLLGGGGGGSIVGKALGFIGGMFHDGGFVGRGGQPTRQLAFTGVPRMHSGGLAGDEVPAVLQTGEGVLSRKGMKNLNRLNMGNGGNGGGNKITVLATINLNAIDAQSGVAFLSQPENIEVFESSIRQALAENGGRDLGL